MLILSTVQFKPDLARGPAEVKQNFKRLEPLLNDIWKTGSQVVVFPELFLTGYCFLSPEEAGQVAEKSDGPTFRAMRNLAVDLNAYVAYGYVESNGSQLFNSATLIDPQGKPSARYRKVNLWGNDFLWASPGSEGPDIVSTDFGPMSLVICRDIRARIPSNIPRTASVPFFNGVKPKFIAACANWGKGGFPSTTWMDFSANHRCTLMLANRWGEERNGDFTMDFGCGGSVIIEPSWKVHTNGLKFNQDCVVTATLEV